MSRPSQVSGSHGKDTATVPPAFNICGLSVVIRWRIQVGRTGEKKNKPNKWIRINESECGDDGKKSFPVQKSDGNVARDLFPICSHSRGLMLEKQNVEPQHPDRQSLPNKVTTQKKSQTVFREVKLYRYRRRHTAVSPPLPTLTPDCRPSCAASVYARQKYHPCVFVCFLSPPISFFFFFFVVFSSARPSLAKSEGALHKHVISFCRGEYL